MLTSIRTELNTFKMISKGDRVPQGDWRIKEGFCISGSWNSDGGFAILGFWGQNDILIAPCRENFSISLEITCVSEVLLEKIDVSSYCEELKTKIQHLESLMKITQIRPLVERIYSLIKWFNERFGNDVKISHQQIADVLNTTRVTVTRSLKELEMQGRIKRKKRKIILVR